VNITRHTGADGEVRLALAGELDLATVDQLHQHVKQELAEEPRPHRLVIDLAEITFCDSTGVGALLDARSAGARHDTQLVVVNPIGMTRTVLTVTGVLSVLMPAVEDDQS
jgi:anti-sigma B factor antagonist